MRHGRFLTGVWRLSPAGRFVGSEHLRRSRLPKPRSSFTHLAVRTADEVGVMESALTSAGIETFGLEQFRAYPTRCFFVTVRHKDAGRALEVRDHLGFSLI